MCGSLFARSEDSSWQHALTLFDNPKYPPDFYAFDYVNLNAPKNGHLNLAVHGTFDTLNAYNGKGVAPSRVSSVPKYGFSELNETLMAGSTGFNGPLDEQDAVYGLIAESVRYTKEKNRLEFKLNQNAKFHDGHPITSTDVIFSFNLLSSLPYGRFAGLDHQIDSLTAPTTHHLIFQLKKSHPITLPLHLAELPVLPEHYWKENNFHKTSLKAPLSSGPYKVSRVIPGKKIELERVKDYWGKDLPVNRGKHNFDRVTLQFYRDLNMAFEAFKGGNVDAYFEVQSKNWATGYNFDAIKKGMVIRKDIPNEMSNGTRAYVFNIRRPYLKDRRVREAISLMLDWDWLSKGIFHNAYIRTESYFPFVTNVTQTVPSEGEHQLLVPFSELLPEQLFEVPFAFPKTKGNGDINHLKKRALKLLNQAGWELQQNKLMNKTTLESMKLVFIHYGDSQFERIVHPFIQNLKTIGVEVVLSQMDLTQYYRRLKHHDFDMTQYIFPLRYHPGEELMDFFHSSSVNNRDGRSLMGLEDPAVDAIIEHIINASDKDDMETATSALNRILLWQHYGILNWHGNTHRIAWWEHLKHPDHFPPYGFSLNTWWTE